MPGGWTKTQILNATETLLAQAATQDEVSVRRIATVTNVNASAIVYHFGSRASLIAQATRRIYYRFNVERLGKLQSALAQHDPDLPRSWKNWIYRESATPIAPPARWLWRVVRP